MKITDFQSGEYLQQYQYRSFSPAPINQPWQFNAPEILTLLSDADRALGELNAFSQLIPDVDFFIQMHVIKEATQSSRIEGTRTNIEEALLNEEDISPEKRDDWEEVRKYIRAINFAIAKLETLPLSNRLLKDTHAILMSGVRGQDKQPGEFRNSQNWIGVSLRRAVFIPPHQGEVPDLTSDLEKFIHNETIGLPHLIKIAIAHYQFETIHPFNDGNGRLGRLMIALYLTSFSLLDKPALYLSDFFERNKTAYVDHLMAVREANRLQDWVNFFLQGVLETAQNSIEVFKGILELKERLEREVLPRFSSRRQSNAQALMRMLYRAPATNVKMVTLALKLNTNTAASLVKDFVKHGILEEITGHRRNRIFVFRDYVSMFGP